MKRVNKQRIIHRAVSKLGTSVQNPWSSDFPTRGGGEGHGSGFKSVGPVVIRAVGTIFLQHRRGRKRGTVGK